MYLHQNGPQVLSWRCGVKIIQKIIKKNIPQAVIFLSHKLRSFPVIPTVCVVPEIFQSYLTAMNDFFCLSHGRYIYIFNPLQTKRRPLYLKPQSLPRCKHFLSGYKNQSVYAVSGTSRCLFSDKYKTHKYSVGRAYSCWMLNCWCIT